MSEVTVETRPAPATQDRGRVAARISADYLLRALGLIGNVAGGDVFARLVTQAIVQINVAHLARDGVWRYLVIAEPPPDTARRPATVAAISSSLGIPYETTRRQVAKMVEQGHCVRVRGGVIVPTARLATLVHSDALRANVANLRRLFRALGSAGVDLA